MQRGSVKTRMARRHYCKLQNTTLVLPNYFVYMFLKLYFFVLVCQLLSKLVFHPFARG